MIAEPIYLLDFRNRRVVELDPAADVDVKKSAGESQTRESLKTGITFAALGSPIDRKD
jgi:hypothetical protein